ncbi:hypothetical protein [Azospirillum sp. TSO22-1]|uniref:hypothetical protein n=1 Tax=Azospirillum sp. TSO22-1 TaxID=716789 RepID=UPI000D60BB3B|nr:hypothetical protein [Azospirillum sp. TSO22-1]PWC55885.1 hypothetical protein TSO221_04090 [Azospirillum sp. TSO22-1]
MSDSYVNGKVREALQAAKGSPSVAQKLLINWAVQDPDLLLGMAQPFLKAIAGAAVARAGRRAAAPKAAGGALSREALERVLSRMGEADDGDVVPQPAARAAAAPAPIRQAPSGVSHEKSMLTLAKAFAAKKVR